MRNENPSAKGRILIACQDIAFGNTLARFMDAEGHEVEQCYDVKGLLRLITAQRPRKPFDVTVLDLDIEDARDAEPGKVNLVSFVRRQRPESQIVLLFDIPKIDRALEGLRAGAYFYLPKTCQPSDIAFVVGKALRKRDTETALNQYEQDIFVEMFGGTPAMKRVIELLVKVAPTDSTVLLLGESGTGKEVLANALHRLSPRHDRPFVAINCAALPETLLESEMFGHTKGAFTGAETDKRGLFEEADGGSIFLDEIGDMAPLTQAKLLRVLQNGEIRPVGASLSKQVDVRVIAATNRDLVEAVQLGRFREDLYFRLNVIQIRIPPLRERLDALPALVGHFIARFNARFGKNIGGLDEAAQALLREYAYPGNVRELESIIAHAVIMSDNETITAGDLPDSVHQGIVPRLALPDYASDHAPTLGQLEEQAIRSTLARLQGNQTGAAKQLGISRSTLWRKMKEFNITPSSS